MLRPRTTVGAYRLTYVGTVSSPELLKTCVMLRTTDALRTVCVAAYSTIIHVITHLMLLPYNLCHTVTQLMLLGHDRTTCVICSVTYDVMSLLATYVRYLRCSTTQSANRD
jgi:hypothetical protein